MHIKVSLSTSELNEYFFGLPEKVKEHICDDLDEAREYPGFNVEVVILEEDNPVGSIV